MSDCPIGTMSISEDIIVRRACAEDIDVLANLAARSFRDTFEDDNDPSNIEDYLRSSLTAENMRAEFYDGANRFLVAYIDGGQALAGYGKLCSNTQDSNVSDKRAVEIERLYADKSVIGQGIGAALMRACLTEAELLGRRTIWLGVWERNDRAIRFYQRWGFEVVGARQFNLGTDIQNDLVMIRKISKS